MRKLQDPKRCTTCNKWKSRKLFHRIWADRPAVMPACKKCARGNRVRTEKIKEGAKRYDFNFRRQKLEYLKTHPCKNCAESDPIVLEFNHLSDKRTNVAHTSSWPMFLKEVGKCETLCANCHRIKTCNSFGWWSELAKPIEAPPGCGPYYIRNKTTKVRNRQYIRNSLIGKSCKDCSQDDSRVFEFDHIDPSTKVNNVSDMRYCSLITLQKELDKCEVVCANCHRRRTAKLEGWYTGLL